MWQVVARRAIKAMLNIIDRVPTIDVYSDEGLKPKTVTGRIDVESVDFSYPARPDIQVRDRGGEWSWWAHTGGANAIAFKQPT